MGLGRYLGAVLPPVPFIVYDYVELLRKLIFRDMSVSNQFQLRSKQAGSLQDESPPEVFYLIFSFIIGDDETLIQEKLSSLRALCLVCRRWRDMVYGEPRLWTSAKVYWDDFPERPSPPCSSMLERRVENFKKFFSRSGNMPLTLHLRWNEYGGCVAREPMQSIASIDRWETISIQFEGKGAACHEKVMEYKLYALAYMKDGHSYFRNVQKFSLRDHRYWPQGTDAASLIKIFQVFPNIVDSEVEIHGITGSVQLLPYMSRLNRLRLCANMWEEEVPPLLNLILAAAPQLEHLIYHLTHLPPTNLQLFQPKPHPVVHANLKHLSVGCTCNAWTELQAISCPALHTLDLGDDGSEPSLKYYCAWDEDTSTRIATAICTMVGQSKCTVQHLSLRRLPLADSDLHDLLCNLPFIRSLSLEILISATRGLPAWLNQEQTVNRFFENLLERSRVPPFAPNLNSIIVDIERDQGYKPDTPEAEGFSPDTFIAFVEDPRRSADQNLRWETAYLEDAVLVFENDVVYSKSATAGRRVIKEKEEKRNRWTNSCDKDACNLM